MDKLWSILAVGEKTVRMYPPPPQHCGYCAKRVLGELQQR